MPHRLRLVDCASALTQKIKTNGAISPSGHATVTSCVTLLIHPRRSEQNWHLPNSLTSGAASPVEVDLRASVDRVAGPPPGPTAPPRLVLKAACLGTTTDLSRPEFIQNSSEAKEAATATLCNTGAHRGHCDPLAGHLAPWPRRYLRPSGAPCLAKGRTWGHRCGSLHSIFPSPRLVEDEGDHLAAMAFVPSSLPDRASRTQQLQSCIKLQKLSLRCLFPSS